jgi:hypothetical protein
MQKQWTGRMIFGTLFLIMTLMLAACGGSANTTTESSDTTDATTTVAADATPMEEETPAAEMEEEAPAPEEEEPADGSDEEAATPEMEEETPAPEEEEPADGSDEEAATPEEETAEEEPADTSTEEEDATPEQEESSATADADEADIAVELAEEIAMDPVGVAFAPLQDWEISSPYFSDGEFVPADVESEVTLTMSPPEEDYPRMMLEAGKVGGLFALSAFENDEVTAETLIEAVIEKDDAIYDAEPGYEEVEIDGIGAVRADVRGEDDDGTMVQAVFLTTLVDTDMVESADDRVFQFGLVAPEEMWDAELEATLQSMLDSIRFYAPASVPATEASADEETSEEPMDDTEEAGETAEDTTTLPVEDWIAEPGEGYALDEAGFAFAPPLNWSVNFVTETGSAEVDIAPQSPPSRAAMSETFVFRMMVGEQDEFFAEQDVTVSTLGELIEEMVAELDWDAAVGEEAKIVEDGEEVLAIIDGGIAEQDDVDVQQVLVVGLLDDGRVFRMMSGSPVDLWSDDIFNVVFSSLGFYEPVETEESSETESSDEENAGRSAEDAENSTEETEEETSDAAEDSEGSAEDAERSSAGAVPTIEDIPVYPDALELGPDSPYYETLTIGVAQTEEGNDVVEVVYTLPADTTFDEVVDFYTEELSYEEWDGPNDREITDSSEDMEKETVTWSSPSDVYYGLALEHFRGDLPTEALNGGSFLVMTLVTEPGT